MSAQGKLGTDFEDLFKQMDEDNSGNDGKLSSWLKSSRRNENPKSQRKSVKKIPMPLRASGNSLTVGPTAEQRAI